MARSRSRIVKNTRTPTGRNVNDYLGRPPRASGTGPKNLAKNASAAKRQVRAGRPRPSVAATPRVRPSRASAGYGRPPGGAAGGIPKATTPMSGTPRNTINKPKTKRPSNTRRVPKPRADFPSQI